MPGPLNNSNCWAVTSCFFPFVYNATFSQCLPHQGLATCPKIFHVSGCNQPFSFNTISMYLYHAWPPHQFKLLGCDLLTFVVDVHFSESLSHQGLSTYPKFNTCSRLQPAIFIQFYTNVSSPCLPPPAIPTSGLRPAVFGVQCTFLSVSIPPGAFPLS